MPLDSTPEARLARARAALEGLSVGDAFGGFYELGHREKAPVYLKMRVLFIAPWHWTDDTNMALSIYSVLRQFQHIDQDKLAHNFALHFDRGRGYGMGARHLMIQMQAGRNWREIAPQIFKGGSYGNGGAMRVAPLGAYFADDMQLVVEQARLSSQITHSHPEGIAGTIAIAVAAAHASRLRGQPAPGRAEFIDALLPYIPDSVVKEGCIRARDLPADLSLYDVVGVL
ncbi:MAG: ADP-ribosylglycohydrolase family protein, partial [Anaerolineae bacterium]